MTELEQEEIDRRLAAQGWATIDGEMVPILFEPVAAAYGLWTQLGQDQRGRTLVCEQDAMISRLEREGSIGNAAERAFLRTLWHAADDEIARHRAKEIKKRQAETAKGKGGMSANWAPRVIPRRGGR